MFYVKRSKGATMGIRGFLILAATVLLSLAMGVLLGWVVGREQLRDELRERLGL